MIKLSEYKFICYQLTRPFSYLLIKHDDKWLYDWLIPLLLTLVSFCIAWNFIPLSNLTGQEGLIADITGFVANLPGFFIAALAAVATFSKHDIDDPMSDSPRIEILYQGMPLMIDMTRRRFLCVLFSYLTAVSIFLVIAAKIGLQIVVPTEYYLIVSWVGFFVFNLFLWQMIIATILGLYYLGERLHTPHQ